MSDNTNLDILLLNPLFAENQRLLTELIEVKTKRDMLFHHMISSIHDIGKEVCEEKARKQLAVWQAAVEVAEDTWKEFYETYPNADNDRKYQLLKAYKEAKAALDAGKD